MIAPIRLKNFIQNIADTLYVQWYWFNELGPAAFAKLHRDMFQSFFRARSNRFSYQYLTEFDIPQTRKSDRVFVFGAGYSLNDITREQWQHISQHDTVSFSFPHHKWVDINYHLLRGWSEGVHKHYSWKNNAEEFASLFQKNKFYEKTILVLQADYRALFCNTLVAYNYIRPGTRVFPYKTQRGKGLPTDSFKEGLRHAVGNLSDAVNFAYCMQWKEIVLAGVDLYDSRNFWLKPDEMINADPLTGKFYISSTNIRRTKPDDLHNTVQNGIIESMGEWAAFFAKRGVRISVLNPKSLLTEVMPVYRFPEDPNK